MVKVFEKQNKTNYTFNTCNTKEITFYLIDKKLCEISVHQNVLTIFLQNSNVMQELKRYETSKRYDRTLAQV